MRGRIRGGRSPIEGLSDADEAKILNGKKRTIHVVA
jgi:hypothetical protein